MVSIQWRRGTITTQSVHGLVGEITVDTDLDIQESRHDWSTAGGHRLAKYSEIPIRRHYRCNSR